MNDELCIYFKCQLSLLDFRSLFVFLWTQMTSISICPSLGYGHLRLWADSVTSIFKLPCLSCSLLSVKAIYSAFTIYVRTSREGYCTSWLRKWYLAANKKFSLLWHAMYDCSSEVLPYLYLLKWFAWYAYFFCVLRSAVFSTTIFEGAFQYDRCHAVYFHVPSAHVRVPWFPMFMLSGFKCALN